MSLVKQSKGSPEIDSRVIRIYKLARQNSTDPNLQEAVSLIKFLRRSIAAIKVWNVRYRGNIEALNLDLQQMKEEITALNQEMGNLAYEKQVMIIDRDNLRKETDKINAEKSKLRAELKAIETEVKVAAARVKNEKNVFGKLTILWTLIMSLFLDDSFELGKIDNNLNPDDDKPQMKTDNANINRSLLDR